MELGSDFVFCGDGDDDVESLVPKPDTHQVFSDLPKEEEPKSKLKPPHRLSMPLLDCDETKSFQHNPFLVSSEVNVGLSSACAISSSPSLKQAKSVCEEVIDRNYKQLREHMSVDSLFPYLIQYDLLTMEQRQEILLPVNTSIAKADKVLHFIPQSGPDSIYKFIDALYESRNGTDHGRLANLLKKSISKFSGQRYRTVSVLPELKLSSDDTLTSDVEKDTKPKTIHLVDSNVIAIQFNRLLEETSIHTGDPAVCKNDECCAVLSTLSKTSQENDTTLWKCEFCGTANIVLVDPKEFPISNDTTYLMSQAPMEGSASAAVGDPSALLVLCIDVSGSMAATTEVEGNFELRRHKSLRKLTTSMSINPLTQMGPRESRNVTHISKMECVQDAIERELEKFKTANPNLRVALITFGDEVTVIGDGTGEEVVITGSRLDSFHEIVSKAGCFDMPKAIRQSANCLIRKLNTLEEGGQTALGPALLVSILLASKKAGSKVIICTDGLANIGVGSLCDLTTDQQVDTAQTFYTDLGKLAVEKCVTVSLITIKGAECRVLELGKVTSATGGVVLPVDPTAISKEFSNILANPVIATDVICRIVLHRQMYLKVDENSKSCLVEKVGNVHADAERSFEFCQRKNLQEKYPPLVVGDTVVLPFQLQITYTTPSGAHMKRVFTKAKPLTSDRSTAEKGIDIAVVGSHSIRTSAKLASEGKLIEARAVAQSSFDLLERTVKDSKSEENMKCFRRTSHQLIPMRDSINEVMKMSEVIVDESKTFPSRTTSDCTARSYSLGIRDTFATDLHSQRRISSQSLCTSQRRTFRRSQENIFMRSRGNPFRTLSLRPSMTTRETECSNEHTTAADEEALSLGKSENELGDENIDITSGASGSSPKQATPTGTTAKSYRKRFLSFIGFQ